MFQQDWSPLINWCNPPFALLGRVLSLLRRQGVRAALVIPQHSTAWWRAQCLPGLPHVRHVWHSGPITDINVMRCPNGSPLRHMRPYAIAFLDFTSAATVIFPSPAAETLSITTIDSGGPICKQTTYLRLHPSLIAPPITCFREPATGSPSG